GFMLSTCAWTVIFLPGGSGGGNAVTWRSTSDDALPRSRSCTLAYRSKTGCTFAWVTTDGTARRSTVARLLRSWGTAAPLTAMEVLRIDSSEAIRYCGVWTTNG